MNVYCKGPYVFSAEMGQMLFVVLIGCRLWEDLAVVRLALRVRKEDLLQCMSTVYRWKSR